MQIRIEIDNYHYHDTPGFFLNILLSFQRNDDGNNEAKNKCGYFSIVNITLLFIAFFALLPLVEMSNFRLFVVTNIFYGLYVCPPIIFIFTHEKLKSSLLNSYFKLFQSKSDAQLAVALNQAENHVKELERRNEELNQDLCERDLKIQSYEDDLEPQVIIDEEPAIDPETGRFVNKGKQSKKGKGAKNSVKTDQSMDS